MYKRWLLGWGVTLIVLTLLVLSVNTLCLQRQWRAVRHEDSRLQGIDVGVHFDLFVRPGTLFFDVRSVAPGASESVVLRALAAFVASRPAWGDVDVKLAYKGEPRFHLSAQLVADMAAAYRTHYLAGVQSRLQQEGLCSLLLNRQAASPCQRDGGASSSVSQALTAEWIRER